VSGDEGKRMDDNVGESNEHGRWQDEDTFMDTALDPRSKYLPDEFFRRRRYLPLLQACSLPKRLALSKKHSRPKKAGVTPRTLSSGASVAFFLFLSPPFNLDFALAF